MSAESVVTLLRIQMSDMAEERDELRGRVRFFIARLITMQHQYQQETAAAEAAVRYVAAGHAEGDDGAELRAAVNRVLDARAAVSDPLEPHA